MGRCKGANGRGRSEAVGLVLWYWEVAQITTPHEQADVARMKAILRRAGDSDRAQSVLSLHLSDRWRFTNQKALCFVQAALLNYLSKLGIETSVDGSVFVPVPVRRAPRAINQ
jgi:hypothetical protein